jgi:glucosamine-6-phosphate deaminase
MLIILTKNYKEMSNVATDTVIHEILQKPNIVLALPTGKTPLKMYKFLVKDYKNKRIDFSKVTCFNLDEYYPIKKTNKNSYHYYMQKNFFNKINAKKSNINILNGETKNPKKECLNYDKKIRKNPIDLVILGVGVNGHMGFNEPGSGPNSKTRLVALTKETRIINSKFFRKLKKVPDNALTLGISEIMSAKKIILLASGKNKARAMRHLVNGPVDKNHPISFLRKHKNLVVILDKRAARLLD